MQKGGKISETAADETAAEESGSLPGAQWKDDEKVLVTSFDEDPAAGLLIIKELFLLLTRLLLWLLKLVASDECSSAAVTNR